MACWRPLLRLAARARRLPPTPRASSTLPPFPPPPAPTPSSSPPPFLLRTALVGASAAIATPLYLLAGAALGWYTLLPRGAPRGTLTLLLGGGLATLTAHHLLPLLTHHPALLLPFSLSTGAAAAGWYALLEAPLSPARAPLLGLAVGAATSLTAPFLWPLATRLAFPPDLHAAAFGRGDAAALADAYLSLALPVALPVGAAAGCGLHLALQRLLLPPAPHAAMAAPLLLALLAAGALYFSGGAPSVEALCWEERLRPDGRATYSANARTGEEEEGGGGARRAADGRRLLALCRWAQTPLLQRAREALWGEGGEGVVPPPPRVYEPGGVEPALPLECVDEHVRSPRPLPSLLPSLTPSPSPSPSLSSSTSTCDRHAHCPLCCPPSPHRLPLHPLFPRRRARAIATPIALSAALPQPIAFPFTLSFLVDEHVRSPRPLPLCCPPSPHRLPLHPLFPRRRARAIATPIALSAALPHPIAFPFTLSFLVDEHVRSPRPLPSLLPSLSPSPSPSPSLSSSTSMCDRHAHCPLCCPPSPHRLPLHPLFPRRRARAIATPIASLLPSLSPSPSPSPSLSSSTSTCDRHAHCLSAALPHPIAFPLTLSFLVDEHVRSPRPLPSLLPSLTPSPSPSPSLSSSTSTCDRHAHCLLCCPPSAHRLPLHPLFPRRRARAIATPIAFSAALPHPIAFPFTLSFLVDEHVRSPRPLPSLLPSLTPSPSPFTLSFLVDEHVRSPRPLPSLLPSLTPSPSPSPSLSSSTSSAIATPIALSAALPQPIAFPFTLSFLVDEHVRSPRPLPSLLPSLTPSPSPSPSLSSSTSTCDRHAHCLLCCPPSPHRLPLHPLFPRRRARAIATPIAFSAALPHPIAFPFTLSFLVDEHVRSPRPLPSLLPSLSPSPSPSPSLSSSTSTCDRHAHCPLCCPPSPHRLPPHPLFPRRRARAIATPAALSAALPHPIAFPLTLSFLVDEHARLFLLLDLLACAQRLSTTPHSEHQLAALLTFARSRLGVELLPLLPELRAAIAASRLPTHADAAPLLAAIHSRAAAVGGEPTDLIRLALANPRAAAAALGLDEAAGKDGALDAELRAYVGERRAEARRRALARAAAAVAGGLAVGAAVSALFGSR
ncbi:hypothetical protein AB1Y20_012309 [Prymnesium parvum]|uniref:Uncharacterized protein n=1 Tax=Prymnesium parvum TaxID=97485 RepID=A0AB34IQV7_PRYPA